MQKNDNLNENKANGKNSSFFDLAVLLLNNLPERSREIIKKRYGLSNSKPETLEKIGKDYGITRERVRQIIADSVRKISKLAALQEFNIAEEKIILEIDGRNGIISDKELAEIFGSSQKESNAVRFFATCSAKIFETEEKGLIALSWTTSEDVVKKIKEFAGIVKEVLIAAGKPLTEKELMGSISVDKGYSESQIVNYLKVLAEIAKNRFEKWGFAGWMEINPKGTREKIYLILKEKKVPLHFTEIAVLIDKSGISKKKSHPQTVHNELIKDERFILIGRGIYALKEWGYASGTIKDVLEDILTKSGKPMTKEEILEEVTKARRVKRATVMINLNNNRKFIKKDNKYSLKR